MPAISRDLVHDRTLDLTGRTLERTAVRGVLLRAGETLEVLMVKSGDGDYSFPGGGIEPGETRAGALRRELREECGLAEVEPQEELLTIAEYRPARERSIAVFKMTSHYIRCKSDGVAGDQQLEGYETDLDLTPVWVRPELAQAANTRSVERGSPPYWVLREAYALELLRGFFAREPGGRG